MANRLSLENESDLRKFITETAQNWMSSELIKFNSFGVQVLIAQNPGNDFTDSTVCNFGEDFTGTPHDTLWYRENAKGKNLICLATGLDSLDAVRLYPGLVARIHRAFPWGGAVIDTRYGIIVGVSGFKEDEDILFARTILNRLIMLLDREGESVLTDARTRGEREGRPGTDRFTRYGQGLTIDQINAFPRQEPHPGTGFAGSTTHPSS